MKAEKKVAANPAPAAFLSMPGSPEAREYFAEHPADLAKTWAENPHYVYFKVADAEGSVGALVAGRSVAVDPKVIPMGAAILITAEKPIVDASGNMTGMEKFTRIVLGQDTGAAIRGARMDIYYGDDVYAQIASSRAAVTGDAAILVAK
jgi:membrane-bound lytic murein transglycosylase A